MVSSKFARERNSILLPSLPYPSPSPLPSFLRTPPSFLGWLRNNPNPHLGSGLPRPELLRLPPQLQVPPLLEADDELRRSIDPNLERDRR